MEPSMAADAAKEAEMSVVAAAAVVEVAAKAASILEVAAAAAAAAAATTILTMVAIQTICAAGNVAMQRSPLLQRRSFRPSRPRRPSIRRKLILSDATAVFLLPLA
jgi:hypothetical protein